LDYLLGIVDYPGDWSREPLSAVETPNADV
jgi:hypothetical protein